MSKQINFAQEVASALRIRLIEEAEQVAVKYPQYQGHFDQWLLVRFNQKVSERGSDFTKGQIALAEPEVLQYKGEGDETHRSIPVWNAARQVCQHVALDAVDFIERDVKVTMRVESYIS